MKNKTKNTVIWSVIALAALLIAAPNGTITKIVTETLDPLWLNVYRFLLVGLLTLPAVIIARKKFNRTNLKYTVLTGISYAAAVACYTTAISLSQASYVAIISLATPILLILFSVYLTKETINHRSYVGITVAALGAFSIIALPALYGGGVSGDVNIAATLLALGNCVSFPLVVIFSRKSSEHGLNLWATLGLGAWIVVAVNALLAVLVSEQALTIEPLMRWDIALLVAFSAIGVSLLSRLITVVVYQHIGSAIIAAMHYLESFVAILLPILILGEILTIEMIIGGFLILIGVLIIEIKHRPHLHLHRRDRHYHHI